MTGVLGAALIALAAGAAILPVLVPQGARGVFVVLLLALAGSCWPFLAIDPPDSSNLVRALWLVGPALLPFGALVPVLYRALSGEGGARLGGLLLHEAWGALLGIPLAHFWLVPAFGLGGALAGLALLGGCAVLVLGGGVPRAALRALPFVLGAAFFAGLTEPALLSPQLDSPAFTRLAFTEDTNFAVTVVDDGVLGERTLLTDNFRATGTGDDYLYMRVLGHLPVLLHPEPNRVAVLAFGTGTTAGAVSLHDEVQRIDVLELSRAVVEFAPHFEEVNHGVLAEGLPGVLEDDGDRVVVHLGDGRHTLVAHPAAFDVITMEPLLPDSPFAVYLYTEEFYARAQSALAPGGLLCQWVPPHALAPETFDVVVDAFTRAFEWSGVFLFGTQVILVGGEAEPRLDGARFPQEGAGAHAALTAISLETPAGALARFITTGDRWPRAARPLTDADPWVLYTRGTPVLARLPENLRRLRELESEPPKRWLLSLGSEAYLRLDGARLLHRAVEAWHRQRAAGMGAALPPAPHLDAFPLALAAAASAIPDDAEFQAFDRSRRFDEARMAGYLTLLQRRSPKQAFELLITAAELRPERADVHLFVAIAAERLKQASVSLAAARRAAELCPRLLETPQGAAAKRLLPSQRLLDVF